MTQVPIESEEPCNSDDWETECPEREDKQHCNHWYDGEPCCGCGDNTVSPGEEPES